MTGTSDVAAALDALPSGVTELACEIRRFARAMGVSLVETVKWGQPSFAPPPREGTPVRLGWEAGRPALYVHCSSPVAAMFRDLAPDADVRGNRCYIPQGAQDPALPVFLDMAFSYKKAR